MHILYSKNNRFTLLPHKSEHKHWDTQDAQLSFLETIKITQRAGREELGHL